jgi:hypothetical protein
MSALERRPKPLSIAPAAIQHKIMGVKVAEPPSLEDAR